VVLLLLVVVGLIFVNQKHFYDYEDAIIRAVRDFRLVHDCRDNLHNNKGYDFMRQHVPPFEYSCGWTSLEGWLSRMVIFTFLSMDIIINISKKCL
jgi:hypothetical protein